MPLKSKAQLEWLKKNRPDLVEEYLANTKNVEKLPEKVKQKKPNSKSFGKGKTYGKRK